MNPVTCFNLSNMRNQPSILFLLNLTLIFLLSFPLIKAENSSNSDSIKALIKEYKTKADRNYRNGEVYEAIANYQAYLNLNKSDVKTMMRLADLYYHTRDYVNAGIYYDSVLTLKSGKYPEALYKLGVVQMNRAQYDLAISSFTDFRKAYRGNKDPEQLRRKAQTHINSAQWAKAHADSVANILIVPLNTTVNQPHIEFSPFLYDEQTLVYGSLRTDDSPVSANFRKLYVASKNQDQWYFQKSFDEAINQGNFHTGNAAFSVDRKRMYFSRCAVNWQNKLVCAIYFSQKTNGHWQEPVKLPYPVNDDNYTSTQPALGQNLRRGTDILYFVSDRPEGKGSLDIWYAEPDRQTGEFQEVRNLGRTVNSYDDDCCPFYDNTNRTLYFSSKGHNSFGGFDVCKTIGSAKQWTEVQTLPQPINSTYDDTYFSSTGGAEGFFTSNRPGSRPMENGSCCDDIFFFRYNECIRVSVSGQVVNSTNYDFYDELNERYHLNLPYPEDNMPLAKVPVMVYKGDSLKNEILVSQTTTGPDGKYKLELDMGSDYTMVVKNYGFFDKRMRLTTKAIDCADTIDMGLTPVNYLPEITVRINVYYEHDKSRLTQKARTTIDTAFLPLFDLFPNAIIEIGSHTDSTGTDEYNFKLSQRRSESVVNYLVEKGISADRLIAKGYGESMPFVPNSNTDGTDNPENRQLNRRTELKVVGELSSFYMEE